MNGHYDLQGFDCVILPGKNCSRTYMKLYDKAFDFWFKFWSDVFVQNGSDARPNPDSFFRQDFVPVITYNGQVVGTHLYSVYDLSSAAIFSQSYLADDFSELYFLKMRELKIERVMTLESLSVHPDFRKSKLGFSLGSTLVNLGQKVFSELTNCEAIICPVRVDNKVTKICADLGFQTAVSGMFLYNTPVDLMFCRRSDIIPSQNIAVRGLVNKLWAEHHRLAPFRQVA